MIMTLFQVALGGAIGSVARYMTVFAATRAFGAGFPVGTMLVNVIGSFIIGAAFFLLAARTHLSPLLITGILGGFTTFSAFSLDALRLWESGAPVQAVIYVVGTLLLSLLAVAAGAALVRGAFA
jgi:fluoride exporter